MRLWLALRRVESELGKDDQVFQYGTKRAQKPRKGSDNIVSFLRVGDNACSICEVAREREQKKQQGKTFARLLTVILDDLRDSSAMELVSFLSPVVTPSEWAETTGLDTYHR